MMAEHYVPVDANADARLLRETEEEKRTIQRICDDLDLEIHEVTSNSARTECILIPVACRLIRMVIAYSQL